MTEHHAPTDHAQGTELNRKNIALDLKSQAPELADTDTTQLADKSSAQERTPLTANLPSQTTKSMLDLFILARQVFLWGVLLGILNVISAIATERLLAASASHQGSDEHQTLMLVFFSISLPIGLAPPFLAGHFSTRRQGNARLGSLAGGWCSLIATLLIGALKAYGPISADQDIISTIGILLLFQVAIGLVLGALGGKYTRWQRAWKKRHQKNTKSSGALSVSPPTLSKPSPGQFDIRLRWQRMLSWCARPDIRTAFVITVGLRLSCSAIAVLASSIKPGSYFLAGEIPLRSIEHLSLSPPPLTFSGLMDYLSAPWNKKDTGWYVGIAESGYSGYGTTAFMPLYPLLIRVLGILLGGHLLTAALLISTIACFGALLCLYRLLERLGTAPGAVRWAMVVGILLPVSFFLAAGYTESLYLWISLASILALLNRQWVRMAVLGMLASLTRTQGLLLSFLVIPLVITILWNWLRVGRGSAGLRMTIHALAGPSLVALAGPLAYLGWAIFVGAGIHKPLPWEPLGTVEGWNLHFTLPGVGIVANLVALAHPSIPSRLGLPSLALDTGATFLAGIAILASLRRMPPAFTLYAIATWCLALAKVQDSGQTMSTARYLLPILPLALLPGEWLVQSRPLVRLIWILAGAILLFFFTWYFLIGAWVA